MNALFVYEISTLHIIIIKKKHYDISELERF